MSGGAGGAAVVTPGAFDAMQALQAGYCLVGVQRLISSAVYSGYAYRVRRSSDNTDMDFLPGALSVDVAAWIQANGAAVGYMTKLYDQSGNARDSDTGTTGSTGTSPTLDCSVSTYPVAVFNGTSNRIAWSGASTMLQINTTAPGITLSMAMQPTGTNSGTAFYQAICTNSGNTSRTSLDFLVTPTLSCRTSRVDGTPTSANAPTFWDLNPHILTGVSDITGGTEKRYIDGVAGTTANFTPVASPNFVASAAVFIGGLNTGSFTKLNWTCSSFYNVALTGANLTALESAMEAAA
jgi:hypothetical protein